MRLTSDQLVFWHHGFVKLNLTIVTTWVIMALLAIGAAFVSRTIRGNLKVSRRHAFVEIVVTSFESQIEQVGLGSPRKYLPFLGSLFIFLATASLLTIVPGYAPPTGSLSTTAALALCVFFAVPVFGITGQGVGGYLKTYLQPTVLMLPFNIIGELTRTLALAVRLFGNMMSGSMIVAILITITPFLFPIVMSALGLLTGMVQAYIFCILATVYIAAALEPAVKSAPKAGATKVHG